MTNDMKALVLSNREGRKIIQKLVTTMQSAHPQKLTLNVKESQWGNETFNVRPKCPSSAKTVTLSTHATIETFLFSASAVTPFIKQRKARWSFLGSFPRKMSIIRILWFVKCVNKEHERIGSTQCCTRKTIIEFIWIAGILTRSFCVGTVYGAHVQGYIYLFSWGYRS